MNRALLRIRAIRVIRGKKRISPKTYAPHCGKLPKTTDFGRFRQANRRKMHNFQGKNGDPLLKPPRNAVYSAPSRMDSDTLTPRKESTMAAAAKAPSKGAVLGAIAEETG